MLVVELLKLLLRTKLILLRKNFKGKWVTAIGSKFALLSGMLSMTELEEEIN